MSHSTPSYILSHTLMLEITHVHHRIAFLYLHRTIMTFPLLAQYNALQMTSRIVCIDICLPELSNIKVHQRNDVEVARRHTILQKTSTDVTHSSRSRVYLYVTSSERGRRESIDTTKHESKMIDKDKASWQASLCYTAACVHAPSPSPSPTMAYTFAITMMSQITYPTPVVIFPIEKSTVSSCPSSAGAAVALSTADAAAPLGSWEPCRDADDSDAGPVERSTGFFTLMTDLEEVSQMSGNTMNGNTIDNMTWDATRSVSMPARPKAAATTSAGTSPKHRVNSRRITGCRAQGSENMRRRWREG